MSRLNPKVSIYVPTKNRISLLERAVSSVLEQSYTNLELIIVDDGSDDGTWEFLKKLSEEDDRVRCFRNSVSRGAPFCRNMAIFKACGEYITGLDDDDYFVNDRIERFVDFWLGCHPDVVAIYSDHSVINKFRKRKKYIRPKLAKLETHFLRNAVGNQIFAKTEAFRQLGGFDESLPVWQDYEFWIRFLKKGSVIKAPFNTYVFDHSHDSERITNTKKEKVREAFEHIVKKHSLSGKELARFSFFASGYLDNLHFQHLLSMLRVGDVGGSIYFLRRFFVLKIKKTIKI